jgi:DNA-binding PucR family transcriptional regulator
MTTANPDGAGLEALLASLGPPERMREFCDRRLGVLAAYDREHGAQLVETLDAYFASGRSLAAAALRLHTHRNTILYRLRRIEKLTGVDLHDPQIELELQVALRIAALLSAEHATATE